MELKSRKIQQEDWDMLSDWWKGHNWPVPARDSLPENGNIPNKFKRVLVRIYYF
jgi:hypothetical protein